MGGLDAEYLSTSMIAPLIYHFFPSIFSPLRASFPFAFKISIVLSHFHLAFCILLLFPLIPKNPLLLVSWIGVQKRGKREKDFGILGAEVQLSQSLCARHTIIGPGLGQGPF